MKEQEKWHYEAMTYETHPQYFAKGSGGVTPTSDGKGVYRFPALQIFDDGIIGFLRVRFSEKEGGVILLMDGFPKTDFVYNIIGRYVEITTETSRDYWKILGISTGYPSYR